jgi:hypothetical protein
MYSDLNRQGKNSQCLFIDRRTAARAQYGIKVVSLDSGKPLLPPDTGLFVFSALSIFRRM